MPRGPMKQPTKRDLYMAADAADFRAEKAEREAAIAKGQVEVLQETLVKVVRAKDGDASEPTRRLRSVDR